VWWSIQNKIKKMNNFPQVTLKTTTQLSLHHMAIDFPPIFLVAPLLSYFPYTYTHIQNIPKLFFIKPICFHYALMAPKRKIHHDYMPSLSQHNKKKKKKERSKKLKKGKRAQNK
jgi:hypothetical protein